VIRLFAGKGETSHEKLFRTGGEFQAPLARAVIGGLFSASLITLVIVPVVYFTFESRLIKHENL
jgi:Cu/Ag efflux pump CusA